VIDTVLLASAIALVTMIQQYSGMNTWLSAKIGGILLYIILGMMALRFRAVKKPSVDGVYLGMSNMV